MLWLFVALTAHATEGMWLPEQVPAVAPAFEQLEIDPETLADPLGHPLGAVVSLGGCTASFVSPEGLIATNHHCVERKLQYLSDDDHDRVLEGYRAASRDDEAWVGPTGRVYVVERITDVTGRALDGVRKRTPDAERLAMVERNEKAIVAECEQRPHRHCKVARFDGGASYRLFDMLEIRDVRLVYAEPLSVGQYGGEIDNWMWPRHSADFAFLRAYVAPDGEPADHAADNVPYRPAHWLEVGARGLDAGDLAFLAGYPGRTQRNIPADALQFRADTYLPLLQAELERLADVLRAHAEADPEAAKRVSPTISGLDNYAKKYRGILRGFARGDLVAQQVADEQAMREWIAADRKRARRWGADLAALDASIEEGQVDALIKLVPRGGFRVSDLLWAAYAGLRWADERELPDLERDPGYQDRDRDELEARLRRMERTLYLPAGRDGMQAVFEAHQALPPERQMPSLSAWIEAQGGIEPALERLYRDPALVDVEARLALLDTDAATLRASDDPWLELAVAMDRWLAPARDRADARQGESLRIRPAWFAALAAWEEHRGATLAHDANGTLRLSFGHVQGYHPEDGLWAEPFTTLSGFARKAGDAPFDAPRDMVEDARSAADGPYADPDLGDVPACFLTDLDTTGGNSGSPILDRHGRLVGLGFDTVWEAVAADYVYDQQVNRAVAVDMRFVRWLLARNPAGQRVLDELTVVDGASGADE